MSERVSSLVVALASLLLLPSATAPLGGQADIATRIDAFVNDTIERTGVAGASVAVVRHGTVVHLAGYGVDSEGSAVGPDTRMRIASLSKSFTALAVMQLVEQGRIHLDTRVQTYLPAFQMADPRGTDITVRHLLHQTTGLSDLTFREMSLPQPGSLAAVEQRFAEAVLIADPGTDWNYHNPNFQLAARLVEMVSGESFAGYLTTHILDPLGMESSGTVDCGARVEGLAAGHILAYGHAVVREEPRYFCVGSGAMYSTASDLARWLVFQGGGLPASGQGNVPLSHEGISVMHTPSPASPIYGLGWYRSTPASGGPLRVSHTGVMGTFSAYQGLFPHSGHGIVVLQNTSSPFTDPYSIAGDILRILEGETPEPAPRAGAVVSWILGGLTLILMAAGIRRISRSKSWAIRRAGRPGWATALILVGHLVPATIFLLLPSLGRWGMGRDGTWVMVAYTLPALVVLLAVGAASSAAVLLARVAQLAKQRRLV